MENKLDILTQKLYAEGVNKANEEAEKIISAAKKEANDLLANAASEAKSMVQKAETDAVNLKLKADAEMALSARQAMAALKQSLTDIFADDVAADIKNAMYDDKDFVQEMMISIIKKWEPSSGNIDLNVILDEKEKAKFEKFVATKYKTLLDKGLEFKVDKLGNTFIISPKNGAYTMTFSDEVFESFFNQYIKSFTKNLLYK